MRILPAFQPLLLGWLLAVPPAQCVRDIPRVTPRVVRRRTCVFLDAAALLPEPPPSESAIVRLPLTAPVLPDSVLSSEAGVGALETPALPPAELTAAMLWNSFGDAVAHLSEEDSKNLFAALQVLLASVPLAVRAARLDAYELKVGSAVTLEPSPALETLAILSAVATARDLLRLRLDAPTIVAALLSDVIGECTPAWPVTPLADNFRLEVELLLEQARGMRALQGAVADLGDQSALVVRSALLYSVSGVGSVEGDGSAALADTGGTADPRALLVLLGAALTRLRAARLWTAPKQQQHAIEAIQLYAPLAHAVGFGNAFAELETLAYAKLFPDSLRRLQRWYQQIWPDAERLAITCRGQLEAQLAAAPTLSGLLADVDIQQRVKSVPSTFRKLLRDQVGTSLETVRDIVGLRVILTPSDCAPDALSEMMGRQISVREAEALVCHGAYRQVLQLWDQVPGRLKDFVTAPKPNGYQSIHTNVRLADGREIEVQIRTHGMHERATVGSASHEGYRAVQLGGGLSAMDGAVERTSLALRGVQAPRTLVTPPRREAREMELAGARMLPQAQRP